MNRTGSPNAPTSDFWPETTVEKIVHFVAPTDIFYNFFHSIPPPILEHLYQVTENYTISPDTQTALGHFI